MCAMRKANRIGLIGTVLVLGFISPAFPCSIPVFRYALEFWDPGRYQAAVFHRGPLEADHEKTLAELEEISGDRRSPLNLEVHTVDLDEVEPESLDEHLLGETLGGDTDRLPWLILKYPPQDQGTSPLVWAGPFEASAVRRIVDSPARREIARRILSGDSAVWVLLGSGNGEKDEGTAALLQGHLEEMEKTLKLPEQPEWKREEHDTPKYGIRERGVPIRLSFSVLPVSRDDPQEQILVRILLGGWTKIEQDAPMPLAFPVYGRGKAMYPLLGDRIDREYVSKACAFLTGECSCVVQRRPLGCDLLINADWEGVLGEKTTLKEALPELTGLTGLIAPPSVEGPGNGLDSTAPAEKEKGASGIGRNTLVVLAASAAVVALLSFLLARRRHPGTD